MVGDRGCPQVSWRSSRSRSWPRLDVLQTHLAARDELVVVGAADVDLPELLGAALVDGDGDDPEAPASMRAQEVGRVGDADRLLAAVLDGGVGANGREGLDRCGVEPSVDDSPWLVVAFVGGDLAAKACRRALVELDVEQRH